MTSEPSASSQNKKLGLVSSAMGLVRFPTMGFPLLAVGESLHGLAAERQTECSSTARDKILFYLGAVSVCVCFPEPLLTW